MSLTTPGPGVAIKLSTLPGTFGKKVKKSRLINN